MRPSSRPTDWASAVSAWWRSAARYRQAKAESSQGKWVTIVRARRPNWHAGRVRSPFRFRSPGSELLTREHEFQPARKRVESKRAGSGDPAYKNGSNEVVGRLLLRGGASTYEITRLSACCGHEFEGIGPSN